MVQDWHHPQSTLGTGLGVTCRPTSWAHFLTSGYTLSDLEPRYWTIPKSGVMSTTSPVPGLAYDGCGVVSSNDLVGVMDEHSVCEPVQPTYLRWPQLRETRLVELLFRQE